MKEGYIKIFLMESIEDKLHLTDYKPYPFISYGKMCFLWKNVGLKGI